MNADLPRRTLGPLKLYVLGGGAALLLAVMSIRAAYPKPLAVILGGAGIAAIIYGILVHARSANASIVLETQPILGETLRGRVISGLHVMPEEVKLALRCIHEWTDFSAPTSLTSLLTSDSRRTRYSRKERQTVWEETTTVPRKSLRGSPSGFSVPFQFELPRDGHRTGYESDDRYQWEIETEASIPGVDFRATFALKVTRS